MPSQFRQVIHTIRIRIHALIVIVVVAWAGYAAVAYLFGSVFGPTHVPEQFAGHITELNAATLHEGAVTDNRLAQRVPMGHYHHVDRWFQPDRMDSCALAGCHHPMPHQKIPAVRAFDNFHATFLACQMCHVYAADPKVRLQWVNTTTGQVQDTPPLLRLIHYLEAEHEAIRSDPITAHAIITDLLTETLAIIEGDSLLDFLLIQLTTSEPDSPVWRHALVQLTQELPFHARGEYGAKLTPIKEDEQEAVAQRRAEMARWARQYLAAEEGSDAQKQIHQKIHGSLSQEPLKCLACHNPDGALFDLEKLGYTQNQAEFLEGLPIAGQIQKVQDGQQFYIRTHPVISP